jgi:CxxC motif-containing protein (DUF1111 family)
MAFSAGCDGGGASAPDAARPDAGAPGDATPPGDAASPGDATPPGDALPGTIAEGIFAPLGEPLPSAAPDRLAAFQRGRDVALRRFTPAQGLGEHFNVTFCAACHEKPVPGGASGRYRDYLLIGQELSQDGAFVFVGVNGVQPQYTLGDGLRFPSPPEVDLSATRNAVPLFGIGLLAEISEAAILANADPEDADGDGISGRPNYVSIRVARFGLKAQSAAVDAFLRSPLYNHLGVTSNPLPAHLREILEAGASGVFSPAQAGAPNQPIVDDDGVPDPELSEGDLFDLASFVMLLAAPEPDPPTPETEAGRVLFTQANCTGCHVPALPAPRGLIPAYSDLLLHDMGPELADGMRRMGVATGSEYRTAPLWGVAASAPYLHDGRADTLDQAIRLHGGEAQAARDAYVAMAAAEQAQVLAFLRSLGGASQASDGLLPPGAEVPAAGDYGGPEVTLAGADLERFRRGRATFDGDVALAAGLGPLFNGDACRACHFEPVIGGAGPSDVNVVHHGIVNGGVFTAPAIGTMALLHSTTSGERPPIDPGANVFELRQTPPLFGLGMIDRIADDAILAAADPGDSDGDGITGRAHVLSDGRLGRLGWKASVPDLVEFARDALSRELGVTVPDQPDATFGQATDSDGVTDPEISSEDLDDLVFYLRSLAPPPRTSVAPVLEDEGELVFVDIGCAACHTPSLPDRDGNDVPLYSDLLLHDVAASGLFGIEEGDAGMRELRTPPLWGLATTAPYMHDGAAQTVEDAILRHAGEAATARSSFQALPLQERNALIAFLASL